jgi:ATP-dependent DNA helicase DinG
MIRIESENRREFCAEEILGGGGVVSQHYDGFEYRREQVFMAEAVWEAFTEGHHLAVEAGTGVGKSFGYLVPAIESFFRDGKKILISTYTITLQEQLINKDIPFLAGCFDEGFTAVLAKGRSNYLCMRRLAYALRRGGERLGRRYGELCSIEQWSGGTKDGSLSDLGFVPHGEVWESVCSEHGNCRGRNCKFFRECFYQRARRELEKADIIVANHAMLFSDLVLKENDVSLLPDYKYAVIDEAHNMERIAEGHFGLDVSSYRVKILLDGLYNPRSRRGLLSMMGEEDCIDSVVSCEKAAREFFGSVGKWYEKAFGETGGRCCKDFVEDFLSGPMRVLGSKLSKLASSTEDADDQFELMRYVNLCGALVSDIENFMKQGIGGQVYWVESSEGRRSIVRLKSAPINVGPDVKRCLFDELESVVTTSATLSSDGDDVKSGFSFFASRVGLDDFKALKLGSPFDYENQVTLYIEKGLGSPNEADFIDAACERIVSYVELSGGGAFVLFTSYTMLRAAAGKCRERFGELGIRLLEQGGDMDRGSLLAEFKRGGRSVLFGTDSFWQGVDVPGEALSNVIIVRLPFGVPNQPLLAGRLEQIKSAGGNPFMDYQVPCAVIKFKQGFGRLIRSKSDRGMVVVLDSRIVTKRYGSLFLRAIPKCKVEIVG